MNILNFTVILLLIIIKFRHFKCLDVYDFTYPLDHNYSTYCHTTNGSIGHCRLAYKCPQVAIEFQTKKIQPVLCYFQQEEPVICCPALSSPNTIQHPTKQQLNVLIDNKSNNVPLQSLESKFYFWYIKIILC